MTIKDQSEMSPFGLAAGMEVALFLGTDEVTAKGYERQILTPSGEVVFPRCEEDYFFDSIKVFSKGILVSSQTSPLAGSMTRIFDMQPRIRFLGIKEHLAQIEADLVATEE